MKLFWSYLIICLVLVGATACGEVEVEDQTVRIEEEMTGENENGEAENQSDTVEVLPETIPENYLRDLEPADGFDFPVGPPDAKNYYKARGFLPKGLEHLGEDWNGTGGRNTDFGDYVYAAADGVVFYADEFNKGWGQVVRILHNFGTQENPRYVETLHAHLASAWVKPSNVVRRGEIIGTMGNSDGIYHAHLHFEMRRRPGRGVKSGYEGDTLGFLDPTAFIRAHRPNPKN